MDKSQPSKYHDVSTKELFEGRKRLQLISKVLKEYKANGKTTEDFAKEFGCDIITDDAWYGITDVKFHNDSNETMFMLKYNNDKS